MSREVRSRRFRRVLVANRGEIAVRVLRVAKGAGYETVAVYGDADVDALHVREADCAVRLGPSAPAESYSNVARILDAARTSGADAVHPGYGFLSERAFFARAVTEAGLVFIGPSAAAIEAMGDKSAAKARMTEAGIPCIAGFHGRRSEEQTEERLIAEATSIGFPLMIKAAAGGGGRGMRLVREPAALPASLASARSEATSAFGDGTLLLERALVAARHVEIQVFGDEHGAIVHFGERDCSIQRRNQKIVEEAPSPAVDVALRAKMGDAAVRAARAVGYVGAGTVEFMLVDRDEGHGAFFFLEMNTRLQVEHPVTELVCGVDLVDLQLRVAQGEPIPWTQTEIDARRSGHAIEVRLCAEDDEFRPRSGKVMRWSAPRGEGIRVDTALERGAIVSPHYDSMLGKIIAHGSDREAARRRLVGALAETTLLGVESNRDLLRRVLETEAFVSGRFDTGFFAESNVDKSSELGRSSGLGAAHAALAALAFDIDDAARLRRAGGFSASLAGWQSSELAPTPYVLEQGDARHVLRVARGARPNGGGASFVVSDAAGTKMDVVVLASVDDTFRYVEAGVERVARYARAGEVLWLDALGACASYVDRTYAAPKSTASEASGTVVARSDGRIVRVAASVGDSVEKGQLLVVLESMKMEFESVAPLAGEVKIVHVALGDLVEAKRILVEIEPAAS